MSRIALSMRIDLARAAVERIGSSRRAAEKAKEDLEAVVASYAPDHASVVAAHNKYSVAASEYGICLEITNDALMELLLAAEDARKAGEI